MRSRHTHAAISRAFDALSAPLPAPTHESARVAYLSRLSQQAQAGASRHTPEDRARAERAVQARLEFEERWRVARDKQQAQRTR